MHLQLADASLRHCVLTLSIVLALFIAAAYGCSWHCLQEYVSMPASVLFAVFKCY